MKKYRANAAVLGLSPGDTFESDHEFYANLAKSKIIEVVSDDRVSGLPRGNVQASGRNKKGLSDEKG